MKKVPVYWTVHLKDKTNDCIHTPANKVADDDELFAGRNGVHHDGVEIKPFTKHPEEVTHCEIMAQYMKRTAPNLKNKILKYTLER